MPASPELIAYPVLLLATYGLFRVGRRRPVSYRDAFEWVRAFSLAILVGVILVVQIHLVAVGTIATAFGLFAASLGVAGALALVGLEIFEMWGATDEGRAPSAPASFP